jgi:hypothetical protein
MCRRRPADTYRAACNDSRHTDPEELVRSTTVSNESQSGKQKKVVISVRDDGTLAPVDLIEYALTCWVEHLATRQFTEEGWVAADEHFSRADFAKLVLPNDDGTGLRKRLRQDRGLQDPVGELEQSFPVIAAEQRGADLTAIRALGWLTAFAREVREQPGNGAGPRSRREDRRPVMPVRMLTDLAAVGPTNAAEALVLGEALVTLLGITRTAEQVDVLWRLNAHSVDRAARGLVTVACRPPGGLSVPAIQLAAQLGPKSLPLVDEHVRHSPVGFRAIRILTRMLLLGRLRRTPVWWSSVSDPSPATADAVLGAVCESLWALDDAADTLPDPYPARSFFVEAFREVGRGTHAGVLPPDALDEARGRLQRRLRDDRRPWRERAYASWVLADGALRAEREEIIDRLRAADPDDASGGLAYTAAVLENFSGAREVGRWLLEIPSHRPTSGYGSAAQLIAVMEEIDAALGASYDICQNQGSHPPLEFSVFDATRQLVRFALATPDGTMRRRACETLRAAGVVHEVGSMLAGVAASTQRGWLAEVAAFLLGYLGDPSAVQVLAELAETADWIGVRHAALFALGDIGVRTAPHPTTTNGHRGADVNVIERVLALTTAPDELAAPVLQAATYALAVLRPRGSDRDLVDEQKERLAELGWGLGARLPDRLVRLMARWGHEGIIRSEARDEFARLSEMWGLDPLGPSGP